MEDFILKGVRNSTHGVKGLKALRTALDCDPSHAKMWYRFGFLLHRQAKLRDAGFRALTHAVGLAPTKSGPAQSEITLVHLERIINARDNDSERKHTQRARDSHDLAMGLNPKLAVHTLFSRFGEPAKEGGFSDVLAMAVETRQMRIAKATNPDLQRHRTRADDRRASATPVDEASDEEDNFGVSLQECEASRAERDVLRLMGDEEAADVFDERLEGQLEGRSLPVAVYQEEKYDYGASAKAA